MLVLLKEMRSILIIILQLISAIVSEIARHSFCHDEIWSLSSSPVNEKSQLISAASIKGKACEKVAFLCLDTFFRSSSWTEE